MIWYYLLAYAAYCFVVHKFVLWHFIEDEYQTNFYWVLFIFIIPLIGAICYA